MPLGSPQMPDKHGLLRILCICCGAAADTLLIRKLRIWLGPRAENGNTTQLFSSCDLATTSIPSGLWCEAKAAVQQAPFVWSLRTTVLGCICKGRCFWSFPWGSWWWYRLGSGGLHSTWNLLLGFRLVTQRDLWFVLSWCWELLNTSVTQAPCSTAFTGLATADCRGHSWRPYPS